MNSYPAKSFSNKELLNVHFFHEVTYSTGTAPLELYLGLAEFEKQKTGRLESKLHFCPTALGW